MEGGDARATVLIVDDEDDIRESIQTILEEEGYRAVGASNGREALRLLQEAADRPCLILLDLMMPVMDGWRLLELLKSDANLCDIPVTVVSAARYQGSVGATRFIKKPLNVELLIQTVKDFCGCSARPRG